MFDVRCSPLDSVSRITHHALVASKSDEDGSRMPFTLAHPAVVLPLRRFSPRVLSFPALVVGSITPDVGYCFGRLNVEEFSHSFVGSLAFCLPVGLLMVAIFYA